MKRLFLPFLFVLLFSCDREKPEAGKAQILVEGINLSEPAATGARTLAEVAWVHPLPQKFSVNFISQESGQTYPVEFSSDFSTGQSKFDLPYGTYAYESSPGDALISSTLPVQFGGRLVVNASQIKTKLDGVSDFQLLTFQKTNIAASPKSILPAPGNLSLSGDFYYLYTKSNLPATVELTMSNGKSFRWGWDARAFSHRSFYFQKESGDPAPTLISDPNFEYQNQSVTLKANLWPRNLNPFQVKSLSDGLKETSGLQWIGNRLFSINDGDNSAVIHELHPDSGLILRSIQVANAPNVDWEDLAASQEYLFIGDFGNNSGNRTDLKILRIPISSLLTQTQVNAEVINFTYQDQTGASNPNLPYDCEAMVFSSGKLYLFTKGTTTNESRTFVLDPNPGNRIAQRIGLFEAPGKLTGADLSPDGKSLVFIGYETAGFSSRAFVLVFQNPNLNTIPISSSPETFWLGSVSQTSQTEGIAIQTAEKVKISGEQISVSGLTIPPRLMEIDLKGILPN
ncbi:hypothetical protein [Algoriphagus mannitolivorans]|uniref:hypothetical protein n=1 Tax=Algoriphagus mannitolivorans TaxID=226504 RepID=UPI0004039B23|nr:hypothetical protein [Algoriphagus mannitolivorans]